MIQLIPTTSTGAGRISLFIVNTNGRLEGLFCLPESELNLVPRLFTRRSPTRSRKDPGSGWSRGHLNYFVLGRGGPKKLNLFDLPLSSKFYSIHSPTMLKSSKQCICNSVYPNVILWVLLGQVIFGVQCCYRLICLWAM